MSDADPGPDQVAAAVQQAVDAVTRRHVHHPADDLVDLLRAELVRRGVDIDDEAWLTEAAGHIAHGHPVVVDEEADQAD
jgi:hypothetical protein